MDETADALRRTRLASERTYLAWWRTALTCLAVGIGGGGVARLGSGSRWAYVGVGTGFIALGSPSSPTARAGSSSSTAWSRKADSRRRIPASSPR